MTNDRTLLCAITASAAMHAVLLLCGYPCLEQSGETGRERLIVSFGSIELPTVSAAERPPSPERPLEEMQREPESLEPRSSEEDLFPLDPEKPAPIKAVESVHLDESLPIGPEVMALHRPQAVRRPVPDDASQELIRDSSAPHSAFVPALEPNPGTPKHVAGQIEDGKTRYLREVVSRIQEAKRYPRAARRKGTTGTARVEFILLREGGISSAQIAVSAGSSVLDEEALATVRRAAPYPSIPEEMGVSRLRLTMSVVFRLEGDP